LFWKKLHDYSKPKKIIDKINLENMHYSNYYDNESIEFVEKICAREIKLFDYVF
jgi:hypothetical protein